MNILYFIYLHIDFNNFFFFRKFTNPKALHEKYISNSTKIFKVLKYLDIYITLTEYRKIIFFN